MKKFRLKLLILSIVFLASLMIFFFSSGTSDEESVSYMTLGEGSLPTVTVISEGYEVNALCGYTAEINEGEAQEALTPLGEDLTLEVRACIRDEGVTGIGYEIRSIDGQDLVEAGTAESWDTDEQGNVSVSISLRDIIETKAEYRAIITLSTERVKNIAYYFRIVYNPDFKTTEMLEYVSDFHASTFDASAMEKYAISWEADGTGDDEDLSYVDIHSSFRQVTYRDLPVKQKGEAQITILDMDEYFGSFRVDSILEYKDSGGVASTYYVSEFFCLQWTSQRFYLMKYERTMTEIFGGGESVKKDRINFGIMSADGVRMTESPGGGKLAFVVNNELWLYDTEENELLELFSMISTDSTEVIKNSYDIKILDVTDDGEVLFFVYGYMRNGAHEGENGASCYYYNPKTGILTESLYVSTGHNYDIIKTWLDKLCVLQGSQIYFLFDDVVYTMDRYGAEVLRAVEDATAHNLVVNKAMDTMAWTSGGEGTYGDEVRVRYIDGDGSILLSAATGEYIMPEGFVNRDFVATYGKKEDIVTDSLVSLYPRYALTVTDSSGAEIARYDRAGIALRRVTVGDGKITLDRITLKDGEYISIDEDVLMQSNMEVSLETEVLEWEEDGLKKKVRYYPCKGSGSVSVVIPGRVASYEGNITTGDDARVYFYAYGGGKFAGKYETAGEAILAVYDDMGYVISSEGYRIWNRTARRVNKTSAAMPDAEDYYEFLNDGEDKVTLVLEGCSLKQVLRFIDKGSVVSYIGEDGNTYYITAYDMYNVWIYDAATGETVKTGQEDGQNLITAGGSKLASYIYKNP